MADRYLQQSPSGVWMTHLPRGGKRPSTELERTLWAEVQALRAERGILYDGLMDLIKYTAITFGASMSRKSTIVEIANRALTEAAEQSTGDKK